MSDGYEEANNLLSATLEQLDDILLHGHRINNEKRSGIHSTSSIPPLLATKNNPFRIMEMKRLETDENGNGKENRDGCWEGNVWSDQERRDSSVSSGAESPPTDLPTSSASSTALCNPFEIFVKALDKDQLSMDKPDLETQVKILRWMTGCDDEVS